MPPEEEIVVSTRHVSWLRVLVEGVVIVGSILLAFWIDAAWQLRGEARERTALLRALQEDFDSYEDLLALRIDQGRRDSLAAERILAVTGPQEAP